MINEQKRSLIINLLMLLVPIYLGRIQEIIPFMANLYVAKIMMGISFLVLFITIRGYSKANAVLSRIPQIKYIIGILIMTVFSAPFSAWPGGTVEAILWGYSKLLLFIYLLIWCITCEEELNKLCWSFVFTILTIDVVSLVNPSMVKGRVFVSQTYDPNDMALLLVIALPLIFYMMENHSSGKKLLLFVVLALTLLVILKTGSRGGLIALIAVLVIIGKQKGIGYVVRRLPIILLLSSVVISFAPGELLERFRTIFSIESDYNMTTSGGRLEIWKRGIAVFFHNPLTGCGFTQFETANGMMPDGTWQTAHNSLIQIGAELGIVGLVLFILLISRSITSLRKSEQTLQMPWLARGTRTALYGFCVGGFFLSWAYSYATYFLIALAIVMQKISLNYEIVHAGHAEE